MKKYLGMAAFLFLAVSCSKLPQDGGFATFRFSKEYAVLVEELRTKGGEVIPDTNSFILSIKKEGGESVYYGTYGEKPQKMELDGGVYIMEVFSNEFEAPSFNSPQYGDSLSVEIFSGEMAAVSFNCRQMNVGMKINYSTEFMQKFPNSKFFLTGGGVMLEYSYQERGIAYFFPGKVEMRMETDGASRYILSRTLNPSEVLTVNMSVGAEEMGEADYILTLDTSRIWITENYEYGKENDGSTRAKALTVRQAMERVGESDIWVHGYIVGGDATSASFSSAVPFESNTHFIISDRVAETGRESCMAIELKSGEIRDSLNLVTNPQLFHTHVFLKGTLADKYFGLVGLKGLKEFYLE